MSNESCDVHLAPFASIRRKNFPISRTERPQLPVITVVTPWRMKFGARKATILRHVAFDVCMDVDKTWRHSQTVSIDHGVAFVVEITDASDSVIAYAQIAPKCWTT